VGKTSVAAAIAVEGAAAGRRAVVVTIDPARRLADALGLDALSNDPRPVPGPWPGGLWAMMLDTKSTFDDLVARYSADATQAGRILDNRFYRNISHALSGTQEYMAAEKLYELHESGRFDLIVVDTPPTRNALDFLDAPNQLARLLDHRVYRVLTAPGRGVTRVVNRAAQTLLRTVGRVIGAGVLEDAVAFFAAFEGMEEGFRQRSARARRLLASDEGAFIVVAAPRGDVLVEAAHFADALETSGITVRCLVVNRVTPRFAIDGEQARRQAARYPGTGYGALLANAADYAGVAAQEDRHIAELAAALGGAEVVTVPLLPADVHDIATLQVLGRHLVGGR
jgi:anion-transporting  ArsA/GET3 family ATPase